MTRTFYEFFCGGGMARLGLGSGWTCLMANDNCEKKGFTYRRNFGSRELVLKDVNGLTSLDMPGHPGLAWASFPCQDLSLAGNRNGLAGERSGAFWGFWKAVLTLKHEDRAPSILVLENVCGLLSSNGGTDFLEVCKALASIGYRFGAVEVDAVHFLPQSRPRLFIVCVKVPETPPRSTVSDGPVGIWHSVAIQRACRSLPSYIKSSWVWWKLPSVASGRSELSDIIMDEAPSAIWHTTAETQKLIEMMSPVNRAKLRAAQNALQPSVGCMYKRTRVEGGQRVQRAEVRFDGIAGCLRTPGGGSSRQTIMIAGRNSIKSRLLQVREAARLMGVPDIYVLPDNYNDGYHVFGDGLAVPAVAFLREHVIDPVVDQLAPRPINLSIAAE